MYLQEFLRIRHLDWEFQADRCLGSNKLYHDTCAIGPDWTKIFWWFTASERKLFLVLSDFVRPGLQPYRSIRSERTTTYELSAPPQKITAKINLKLSKRTYGYWIVNNHNCRKHICIVMYICFKLHHCAQPVFDSNPYKEKTKYICITLISIRITKK